VGLWSLRRALARLQKRDAIFETAELSQPAIELKTALLQKLTAES
jgi:hypothetical protein